MKVMPYFSYSCVDCAGLNEFEEDDKVSGKLMYEVVKKDEHGISIKITGLNVNSKKRKLT